MHAVTFIPFYRDQGLARAVVDVPVVEALSAFPLIDKYIVRQQAARFIAEGARRPLFKTHTSGTSGTPLTLYQDLTAINRENAFIWRQLEWSGLKRGDRRAWLRGDLIVPVRITSPPFWRMNYVENMLMFSSYHLSETNALAYISALEHFDPVVIQAYPSSIAFLARCLKVNKLKYVGRSLRGIVTSSETLDEKQRIVIESCFGCTVFDWYGQTERVAAIGTCEHGRKHLISDYSWVEFLPSEEGRCEIVGTGFNNFAMPLIRYRTGDFVVPGDTSNACPCGRDFPVIETVWGRDDDAVKLANGGRITALFFIFKEIDSILEAQIRQDKIDCVNILVVPSPGYNEGVTKKILDNARKRLGNTMNIEVKTVDFIPRTQNGKLRTVVCNV